MKAKVTHLRKINDKRMEVIIAGINQFSEYEICKIIQDAFKNSEPGKPMEEFEIGDKVMYRTAREKNPFDHMRVAHNVDYCIIKNITENKFRSGGVGYTLVNPDNEKFIAVVSAKWLIRYI